MNNFNFLKISSFSFLAPLTAGILILVFIANIFLFVQIQRAEAKVINVNVIWDNITAAFKAISGAWQKYVKGTWDKVKGATDIIKDINEWTKSDSILGQAIGLAAELALRIILAKLTQDVINWINGGGSPKFISNWGDYLRDAVSQAGGEFLTELGFGFLCKPFAAQLKIALAPLPPFRARAQCTLDDIVENIEEFYDDFAYGGWEAWIRMTEEPQNNIYGAYVLGQAELMGRMAAAEKAAESEGIASGGFIGDKICVQCQIQDYDTGNIIDEVSDSSGDACDTFNDVVIENNKENPTDLWAFACVEEDIKTPGKTVQETAQSAINTTRDTIIAQIGGMAAKAGGFFKPYIMAIANALIGKMINKGLSMLKGDQYQDYDYGYYGYSQSDYYTSVSRYDDTTSPITSYSVYDAYSVELSANKENAAIFYTTDDSDPNSSATAKRYNNLIQIGSKTTIKWFGISNNDIDEINFKNYGEAGKDNPRAQDADKKYHQATFEPPLKVEDKELPFAYAVPVGPYRLGIIANKPAKIFYTIDGSEPDKSSQPYFELKNLDSYNNQTITIKITSFDIRERPQESIKTQTFKVPLEPPYTDLKMPEAIFTYQPAGVYWTPTNWTPGMPGMEYQAAKYITLEPYASDGDDTDTIIRYEWDLDNNGDYDDWILIDYNRDGVIDVQGAQIDKNGINRDSDPTPPPDTYYIYPATDKRKGSIIVIFQCQSSGNCGDPKKYINLRVTDDEGMTTTYTELIEIIGG